MYKAKVDFLSFNITIIVTLIILLGARIIKLGPLLFVLYINDLPDSIKSFTKLFADDLKMIAKASDKLQVDNDLKMLELQESTWLLEFNVKKCKVLHTSFNNNPHNTYHLNKKVMLMSDQEKDLGVL